MSEPDVPKSRGVVSIGRYALAVVSVAIALVITSLLRSDALFAPLFFLAIILSAWFGGIGPGLLAALLATLCIDYFFLEPFYKFKFNFSHFPQLLVFFISAVMVSSWSAVRRRAERLLRQARDEQEAIVQQRTEELAKTEQRLRAVIANAPIILFAVDSSGVFTLSEGRGLGDLQLKAGQLVGQSVFDTYRDSPQLVTAIRRALAGESFMDLVEMNGVALETHYIPVRGEGGQVTSVNGVAVNVTERKRAEEKLQKTQAELAHIARVTTMGELTSSIAHEVNQPLAAIVTNGNACLRWLSNRPPNVEEARQTVTRMVKDGHRASEVVGRIRAFFRKAVPQKTSVNINHLIQDVIAMVPVELRRNRVQVQTELADDLPPVLGDQIQLQQVVLNLLINAIEAMTAVSGPRQLLIKSLRYDNGSVLVSVQDSGVGFDDQDASQLFNPFYTTKQHGLGMGLSISRTTIEAYGGRLWATPNNGAGSTFHFTLPASNGDSM